MDMLHIVYVAEAMLGAPIERVSAWVTARTDDAPVEDIALARFETSTNAALVNVGWGVGMGGFAVSGPLGRIEVTYEDGGNGAFAPDRTPRRPRPERSRRGDRPAVRGRRPAADRRPGRRDPGRRPADRDRRPGRPHPRGDAGGLRECARPGGRGSSRSSRASRSTSAASPAWPSSSWPRPARSRASGSSASADHRSSDGPLPVHGFGRQAVVRGGTRPRRRDIGCAGRSRSPPAGSPRRRHMRIDDLLADAGKRRAFADAFAESRAADRRAELLGLAAPSGHRDRPTPSSSAKVIRLAAELGVDKIVTMSGNPGDGPGAHTINWVWYPWPAGRPRPAGTAMGRGDPVLAGDGPVRRRTTASGGSRSSSIRCTSSTTCRRCSGCATPSGR